MAKVAASNKSKFTLTAEQSNQMIETLHQRFTKNTHRHKGIKWEEILAKLKSNSEKLWSVYQMEITGGEPDVVGFDTKKNLHLIVDCAAETPKGRRSLCYDKQGLDSRKEFKPQNNVVDMATEMGVELLDETQYRELQNIENFDTKTSSWLLTPPEVRKLGGAIFGDFRYGRVFVYHNGAQSYYGGRAFRACLYL